MPPTESNPQLKPRFGFFFLFCFVVCFVLFFNIAEAKVLIRQRQETSATARI